MIKEDSISCKNMKFIKCEECGCLQAYPNNIKECVECGSFSCYICSLGYGFFIKGTLPFCMKCMAKCTLCQNEISTTYDKSRSNVHLCRDCLNVVCEDCFIPRKGLCVSCN